MTVHMFRCYIGRGPMDPLDLEIDLDDWVQLHDPWEDDPVDHTMMDRNTAMDGTGEPFHQMDVRFLLTNTKDDLLQDFTNRFRYTTDWYRIGYHACTHRQGDGSSGPCSWDDSVEWSEDGVTIPEGVPTITVQ